MPVARRVPNSSVPPTQTTTSHSDCVRCGYPTHNQSHDDCCPDGVNHQYDTQSQLANKIAAAPHRHDNGYPLWQGPCAAGPLGGITQSMLVRFMSCRERFRLKYVLGLEPPDRWNKNIGYGNMWHVCEEVFAKFNNDVTMAGEITRRSLLQYTQQQMARYPMQREEIEKWYNVCCVQFPEYAKYWANHPDVQNRTPLVQEQVFDVPYALPSGRVVRLRGKFDSVDLIDDGIYLQENKTKGDIDKLQVERQLKFDLQTMLYLIALSYHDLMGLTTRPPIRGVRYNVIRRPLSGGVGSISPHKAKSTKTKITSAETAEQFYERLRSDYIAADPVYWFFRVRSEVSAQDIQVFRETCLDPLLGQLCWWYDEVTCPYAATTGGYAADHKLPPMNYRTPFGVWSALEEGGSTEYDAYLATGSEAGLRRVETMFEELQ